ncbi:hypothetical protein [Noviherbaspirillum denitrificans]|uniref:Oligosaccharide repeat unit polymerase n=1 Tax=Noviherbaspirillum denitrificans TaxID=1968433 RepID=A0A254T8T6_9BURK|nr:hypothetical protein [Noviherbaspirillum denitrificans]OWW18567.1 hypothetical protein AYR66_00715 [Noviherbaspirillum denitrificans]
MVLVSAVRYSAFGVLLCGVLVWFLIGDCVYPLFYFFGSFEPYGEVADFISRHGAPGFAAALHILLTAAGMACGYFLRPRIGLPERVVDFASAALARASEKRIWLASILLGVAAYALYFKLVGVDVALTNAAAARGGDFEGFGEKDAYMFLKTVAAIGLVAQCFAAIALIEKNKLFIAAYIMLVATAYANSISRNLLLYTAIVPVLVYLRLKPDVSKKRYGPMAYAILIALIPAAFLIMTYGKVMGHYISAYFTGDYYSVVDEIGEVGVIDTVLNNFGFQWVSVQAGIDHFNHTGIPLITRENALATLFGAIPSRVLGAFGLDFLYYGNVTPTLACINTEAFGYDKCTVPPLAVAYSAYLLPGAGGFLMGYLWLRSYVAVERQWISMQKQNWRKLWIPYFWWGFIVNLFTFIPSTIAVAMTQLLWLAVLALLPRKVVWRRKRQRPAVEGTTLVARG